MIEDFRKWKLIFDWGGGEMLPADVNDVYNRAVELAGGKQDLTRIIELSLFILYREVMRQGCEHRTVEEAYRPRDKPSPLEEAERRLLAK